MIVRNECERIFLIIQSVKTNGMEGFASRNIDMVREIMAFPKHLTRTNFRGKGLEFGYYCAVTKKNAGGKDMRNGVPKPELRRPTLHPKTKNFQAKTLTPIIEHMWGKLTEFIPAQAKLALERTPKEYRFPATTGFSKVTVALNNATPYHYDRNNLKGSMCAIFVICDDECVGG
jgi:hypothetical protein